MCSARTCGSGSCRASRTRRRPSFTSRRGRDLMPYWPPDTPPSAPEQMPQAMTPGPAPVPYAGPGMAIAPDMLAPVPDVSASATPGPDVMAGTAGANHVSELPLGAPNVNTYDAGAISPGFK